ncbi:MAG: formimidoylglutamate deiminase [Pseudomonadota bacterium]
MQYVTTRQTLTGKGWQTDIQIAIGADGRIAAIGPATNPTDHQIDVALPAPTNLHSHSFQRAMAGLTEMRGPDPTDSFWTWRRLMYRFLDQLTPDQIEAIAAQVFMEMLEAGYGAAVEFHYLHHGVGGVPYDEPSELSLRHIAAAQAVGIGLTHLPVLYQFGGCDGRALEGGQQRFGSTPDSFAALYDGASAAVADGPADFAIGVAPHSLRAVDAAGIDAALSLAPPGPTHMHLSEQTAEIEEVQAHLGARPAEWLLEHYAIDERWCLIHCTHLTTSETTQLAHSGAIAGLCPITESNLGDGIFNGTGYLGAGGRIGFGSDSNVHIALFEELRTLEYSQRLRDRGRAALATSDISTGRRLLDEAARGGAQAAGRFSGVLEVGAWADILGISTDNMWACGRLGDTLLDTLVFGGHGQDCITDVWSAGRHVVQSGRHVQREAISRQFQATMSGLASQL